MINHYKPSITIMYPINILPKLTTIYGYMLMLIYVNHTPMINPWYAHDDPLGSPAPLGRFRLPDAPRWDAVAAALQRLLLMRTVLALERVDSGPGPGGKSWGKKRRRKSWNMWTLWWMIRMYIIDVMMIYIDMIYDIFRLGKPNTIWVLSRFFGGI